MADKSKRPTREKAKPAPPAAGAGKRPVEAPATPVVPPPPNGLFPELGIRDETQEFGSLASGDRSAAIDGVIVHRTESPSMESTRNSYRTQMEKGNHVGAHYLVGLQGETSLTVPTDKTVSHVRGNKDSAWKGANARTVGIENVGMTDKLDPKKQLRPQVEKMDLPPGMRARLLAMDDKTLKATLADGGYEVHKDITGPQKRANWNLVGTLAREHSLDIGSRVQAHEDVDHKTLGEGEPIKEFLTAMQSYPARVAALEQKIAAARAAGTGGEELAALEALLAQEKATMQAVAVDKTAGENTLLEAEAIMDQPGPASAREADRVGFYGEFWKRSQGLDAAAAP